MYQVVISNIKTILGSDIEWTKSKLKMFPREIIAKQKNVSKELLFRSKSKVLHNVLGMDKMEYI